MCMFVTASVMCACVFRFVRLHASTCVPEPICIPYYCNDMCVYVSARARVYFAFENTVDIQASYLHLYSAFSGLLWPSLYAQSPKDPQLQQ